jgi:hypothetical protein
MEGLNIPTTQEFYTKNVVHNEVQVKRSFSMPQATDRFMCEHNNE